LLHQVGTSRQTKLALTHVGGK